MLFLQADWQREILNSFVIEKIDDCNTTSNTTYNTTVRGSVLFRLNELVEMEEVLTSVTLRCLPFLEKILENNNDKNNSNSNNNYNKKNKDDNKNKNNKNMPNTVYEEIARLKGTVKTKTVKKGRIKNAVNEGDDDKKKGGGLQEEEVNVLISAVCCVVLWCGVLCCVLLWCVVL